MLTCQVVLRERCASVTAFARRRRFLLGATVTRELGIPPLARVARLAAVCGFLVVLTALPVLGQPGAEPDLVIRDDVNDTGVEPNPNMGAMWVSPDIWVRTTPDPLWTPYPFIGVGPGMTPSPNPEYRDPRLSVPNYLYVRVQNFGTAPSVGTERLRVYWAKASTGLAWDPSNVANSWVDNVDPIFKPPDCTMTVDVLVGREITKVRRNVANVDDSERTKLLNAILGIDTKKYYDLFNGVTTDGVSYWDKQDQIHQVTHVHSGPSFLPWHRELINRFEVLLQEVDPTVMLHYWDWTTDPRISPNLFTTAFMGSDSGRAGAPFDTFDNNGDFNGSRNETTNPADPPQEITRAVAFGAAPPSPPTNVDSDAVLVGWGNSAPVNDQYKQFRERLEGQFVRNHDFIHAYIGGTIGIPHTAFEDPFVFLLHSNVDRLFAQWQRNTSQLQRLFPDDVYGSDGGGSGFPGSGTIPEKLSPWAGIPTPLMPTPIFPWNAAGGHIVVKTSKDPSVVSPPYYDTAPLVVPVLLPGESAILQIPWYPPNPADFSCLGSDMGHVCVIARIEEAMAVPEGMDIYLNTQNNNNIAWRNLEVLDLVSGAQKTSGVLVRNVNDTPTVTKFCFNVPPEEQADSLFGFATLTVTLQPALYQKWLDGGSQGNGIQLLPDGRLRVLEDGACIENITLAAGETHGVNVTFELTPDHTAPAGGTFSIDMAQYGAPGDTNAIVGGQRFTMDFNKGACCDQGTFGGCTETTNAGCQGDKLVWHKLLTCEDIECLHNAIPTVSEWGLVVLTVLLLIGVALKFGRRLAATAP